MVNYGGVIIPNFSLIIDYNLEQPLGMSNISKILYQTKFFRMKL